MAVHVDMYSCICVSTCPCTCVCFIHAFMIYISLVSNGVHLCVHLCIRVIKYMLQCRISDGIHTACCFLTKPWQIRPRRKEDDTSTSPVKPDIMHICWCYIQHRSAHQHHQPKHNGSVACTPIESLLVFFEFILCHAQRAWGHADFKKLRAVRPLGWYP